MDITTVALPVEQPAEGFFFFFLIVFFSFSSKAPATARKRSGAAPSNDVVPARQQIVSPAFVLGRPRPSPHRSPLVSAVDTAHLKPSFNSG